MRAYTIIFHYLHSGSPQEATCPTSEQRELAQRVVTASFNDFTILTEPVEPIEPIQPTNETTEPTVIIDHPCGPGNWTQVVLLNLSDPSQLCPQAWTEVTVGNVRACTRPQSTTGSCISTFYPMSGVQYNRVCGRSIGYQDDTTDAFLNTSPQTIDSFYVDGVSITHGAPRQHIWSFASGLSESPQVGTNGCFCGDSSITPGALPPTFVGNDYFCESGNPNPSTNGAIFIEDPLWDGLDCPTNNCCEFNNPPWFNTELPGPTTDNLEVRLCCDQDTTDENILLQLLELYVSNQPPNTVP